MNASIIGSLICRPYAATMFHRRLIGSLTHEDQLTKRTSRIQAKLETCFTFEGFKASEMKTLISLVQQHLNYVGATEALDKYVREMILASTHRDVNYHFYNENIPKLELNLEEKPKDSTNRYLKSGFLTNLGSMASLFIATVLFGEIGGRKNGKGILCVMKDLVLTEVEDDFPPSNA